MFGANPTRRQVATGLVLAGFSVYVIRLFLRGDITLYIHPRYSWFAFGMALVALLVLMLGIGLRLKRTRAKPAHTHHKREPGSGRIVNAVACLVLVLALVLPARGLSIEAIGQRSIKLPAPSTHASLTECPADMPLTIDGWVFMLSDFAESCFEGQPIELSGYALESPDSTPPPGLSYFGQAVLSCCAVDAQPYALPLFGELPGASDQWYTVRGQFEYRTVAGTRQLGIAPSSVTPIETPSNPYQFLQR